LRVGDGRCTGTPLASIQGGYFTEQITWARVRE
jgi:hypothetical protein